MTDFAISLVSPVQGGVIHRPDWPTSAALIRQLIDENQKARVEVWIGGFFYGAYQRVGDQIVEIHTGGQLA